MSQQERHNLEAVIKRTKHKIKEATMYAANHAAHVKSLQERLQNTERMLAALVPEEFTPHKNAGGYFPNIYYYDVYNSTAGGEVVDRMSHGGMLCDSKVDAQRISGYLKIVAKIANYAIQANNDAINRDNQLRKGSYYISSDANGTLFISPYGAGADIRFYREQDAKDVLNKFLTENDRRILLKGIS